MSEAERQQKKAAILNDVVETSHSLGALAHSSIIEKVKLFIKKNGKFYYFILRLVGPVFSNPSSNAKIRHVLQKYSSSQIIVNVGSGPSRMSERDDILNVDIFPYPEVDIVSDGKSLPIRDQSVDLVLSIASLEHVPHPDEVVREMFRISKNGGRTLIFVPFMQPFHAAPNDYQRWTKSGLVNLVHPYQLEDVWIGGGPTSGMLWIAQEWLAIALSFGSKRIAEVLLLIFMLLTFPIKWLDLILVHHPYAGKIASGFYVLAKKEK